MYLSGVGTEHHTQAFQSTFVGTRTATPVQRVEKDEQEGRKIPATSSTVQDRVTLSREAQNRAENNNQEPKAGQGTPQDSRSPFDR